MGRKAQILPKKLPIVFKNEEVVGLKFGQASMKGRAQPQSFVPEWI
jgi:hypothetical protein